MSQSLRFSYNVAAMAGNRSCVSTKQNFDISMASVPTVSITGDSTFCSGVTGDGVDLTATSQGESVTAWAWYKLGGSTQLATDKELKIDAPTPNQSYVVSATTANSCVVYDTVTTRSLARPSVTIDAIPAVCNF